MEPSTTDPAGAPMPTPTGAPDPAGASGAPADNVPTDDAAPVADGAVNPAPTEPTAGM